MKAALYKKAGKFEMGDAEVAQVKNNEVKVAVHYCGICGTDLHYRHGSFEYRILDMPGIPGHECSGVIEEVGSDVTKFKVGDRVVVKPLESCGHCNACKAGYDNACMELKCYGIEYRGSFAQYYVVSDHVCHHMPEEMSMMDAALVEPMSVACHVNDRAEVKKDENVVVLGGGPIGVLVAMVSKYRGANVIISEANPARIQAAKALGFDTINPMEVDVVEYVKEKTNGLFADTIFEVAGVQATIDTMTKLVHTRSKVVIVAAHQKPVSLDVRALYMKECDLLTSRTCTSHDMEEALKVINSKMYDWSKFIAEVYPLSKIDEAMDAAESGKGGLKVMVDCQNID